MTEERRTCPNCGTPLQGAFCHACGQKDVDLQRGLFDIVREGLSEIFEIDGKLPRSLVALLVRPGDLTRRWLDGERSRFSSPVRLYLFAVVLALFVVSCTADRNVDRMAREGWIRFEQDSEAPSFAIGDPATPDQFIFHARLGHPEGAFDAGLMDYIEGRPPMVATRMLIRTALDQVPMVLVGMMVLTTLFLQLAWWRRYLVEHALFSLNLHTVGLYAMVVALAVPWVGDPVASLVLGVHLVLGLRRVYGATWPRTLAAAGSLGCLWGLLFFVLTLGAFVWSVYDRGNALLDAREIEEGTQRSDAADAGDDGLGEILEPR